MNPTPKTDDELDAAVRFHGTEPVGSLARAYADVCRELLLWRRLHAARLAHDEAAFGSGPPPPPGGNLVATCDALFAELRALGYRFEGDS